MSEGQVWLSTMRNRNIDLLPESFYVNNIKLVTFEFTLILIFKLKVSVWAWIQKDPAHGSKEIQLISFLTSVNNNLLHEDQKLENAETH